MNVLDEAKKVKSRQIQTNFLVSKLSPTEVKRFTIKYANWLGLVLFLLATAAYTWPLIPNLGGSLFDLGDPADSSWRLGSIAYQLIHDPLHLYQSTTLYPVQNVLTLDELLTGNALLAAPLIWLTANPVLAFNLLVFASFALSGWAMFLLTRHLTGSSGAGIVAGLVFTFSPWHYAQHGHLGIGATEWMVFSLFFLILFLENRKPRRYIYLALFSFFLAFQALAAGYLGYFVAIVTVLYLTYYFLFEGGLFSRVIWYVNIRLLQPIKVRITKQKSFDSSKPNWTRIEVLILQLVLLAFAGFIALLIILPFALPFIQTQQQYAFKRDLSEVRIFSASPSGLLLVPEQSWLLKVLHLGFLHKQAGERALWPGLFATLLALFGLIFGGQKRFSKRRFIFGFIALFGLVLAFGPYLNLDEIGTKPTDIALPYLWFYQIIPGFDALRVPYRFGAIFMLGLAVCAGYGVATLQRISWARLLHLKFNWRILIATIAILLVGAEFFAPNLPMQPVGMNENTPPVYKWLASAEASTIVPPDAHMLELPLDTKNPVNSDPIYSLYNLQYRRPLLDGSANIVPDTYTRLFNEEKDFPNSRSLEVLEGIKVQFLIVHQDTLTPDQRLKLNTELETGDFLETVKTFPNTLLLKVKPNNSFAKLISQIPANSQIFLADENVAQNNKGLYTNALMGVLGNRYQYFSNYRTLYNITPHIVQAHKVYDFAILYKGTDITNLGYNATDQIFSNDTIDVYARRNGLEALFDFQVSNRSFVYPSFSADKPLHLNVTANNVSSTEEILNNSPSIINAPPNHILSLLLAAPEPQDVNIQFGSTRQTIHLDAGFYRYFLDIATPQTFALSVKGPGNAYLLQARLSSNRTNHPADPQRLVGQNWLIWQVNNSIEPNSNSIVNTSLLNYSGGKSFRFDNASLVISITSIDNSNDSQKNSIKKPLPEHLYGQWVLPIPETSNTETQNLNIKVDLQKQQATATLDNANVTSLGSLPLSNLDGTYRADIGITGPGTELQHINSYNFTVSHINNVTSISNIEIEPPNALLLPPNSSVGK